jgi:two-component system invasion response regulator UvrY
MTKIFLLDDHQMVREGLRAVLQSSGHNVVGESDVTDGLVPKLKALGVEVLVLDVNLKNASGLAVLRTMQLECPDIRTIVLSMSSQPSHISEALRFGALGYVLKGSPSSELLQAISAITAGKQFLGDQVRQLQLGADIASRQANPAEQLSMREIQILKMVVTGKTSAAIAAILKLSPKTVETYRSRLMAKLGLHDVPALVRFALQWGLADLKTTEFEDANRTGRGDP